MVELTAEEGDYQPLLIDAVGLLLVGVVGSVGILNLLRHSWVLGISCVILATFGRVISHRHFNRD